MELIYFKDIEKIVLGGIVKLNGLHLVKEINKPEEFQFDQYKKAFEVMLHMEEEGITISEATLKTRLEGVMGDRSRCKKFIDEIMQDAPQTLDELRDQCWVLKGNAMRHVIADLAREGSLLAIYDICSSWYSKVKKRDGSNYDLTTTRQQVGSQLRGMPISIKWLVKNLIPEQSLTLLHGKGGIGKTWLSLILAYSVSSGRDFLGLPTRQKEVIYIDFENPLPVLISRIENIGIEDVMFIHNGLTNKPVKLDGPNWTSYKNLPANSLLIFDTFRAAQDGDENDSQAMSRVMSNLKELRDMGFTILLLHHSPKSNDRTYKGSTAILDLCDQVLSLHELDNGIHYFGTGDKTRYERFEMYLNFDPEVGFKVALDPANEKLKELRSILLEKGRLNQSQMFEEVKKIELKSKGTLVDLLRKGSDLYWKSVKEGKSVYYEPLNDQESQHVEEGGHESQITDQPAEAAATDEQNASQPRQ